MRRPTMLDVMMAVAHTVAERSTCTRQRVGCVIADGRLRQVLSFGYNGNYAGGPNVCDATTEGSCGCLHAEENAIIKLTSESRDMILFTTCAPCVMCAKRIINQGGIARVVWDRPYRDVRGLEILADAGIYVKRGRHDEEGDL